MPKNQESDLIDDRALDSAEPDQFGLDEFADELESLIKLTQTPVNIALYAAWGAGKSSLANLLQKRLAHSPKLLFVRFDAFKYAETPLRRHFLSQVAYSLGVHDNKFHRDLYATTRSNDVTFPGTALAKLIGIFFLLFAIFGGTLTILYVTLPLILPTNVIPSSIPAMGQLLGGAGALSAVASALWALGGKTFTYTIETEVPSSEEVFDQRFQELVSQLKASKIVIFIDELDRCGPSKVVSTLETLRTFLEVDKCVFIVAADQNVLERSLSEKVRQSTPINQKNPDYTAGSEFLDKIFQYQLSLPEKKPRRLSQFALRLTREKEGIWNEVDRDAVVSVLIPSHVTSPRRVKVLLNAFVIAYRLARRRVSAAVIAGPINERAPELAKLVCLRHEFPLFARDLTLDWRLPDIVQHLAQHGSIPDDDFIRADVKQRATDYVDRTRAVASVLAKSTEHEDTELIDQADPEESSHDREPSHEREPGISSLESAHASQLLQYLQKTASIQSPRPDLIMLESAGAAHGLDPTLAEQVEYDAVNGRVDQIVSIVQSLPNEHAIASLQLIGEIAKEQSVGVEGSNAVSSLLGAIGSIQIEAIDQIADGLADAVAGHSRTHALRENDLQGALYLGLKCSRPIGTTLVANVLSRDEIEINEELTIAVLLNINELTNSGQAPERIAEIFAAAVVNRNITNLPKTLRKLDDSSLDTVAAQAGASIDVWLERGEEDESIAETVRDSDQVITMLSEIIDITVTESMHASTQTFASLLLDRDSKPARDAINSRILKLAPINSVKLATQMLGQLSNRDPSQWPRWIDAIKEVDLPRQFVDDTTNSLLVRLFNLTVPNNDQATISDSSVENAISSIKTAFGISDTASQGVYTQATKRLSIATDEQTLSKQIATLRSLYLFAHVDAINPVDAANAALNVIEQQLQHPSPSEQMTIQMQEAYKTWIVPFVQWSTQTESQELTEALSQSPWASGSWRSAVILLVYSAIKRSLETNFDCPMAVEDIAGWAQSNPKQFESPISAWLDSFQPPPKQAVTVVDAYSQQEIGSQLRESIAYYVSNLDSAERKVFAKRIVNRVLERVPSHEYVNSVRLGEGYEDDFAELLFEVFNKAGNNDQRGNVLALWRLANPSKQTSRARLIRDIYVPMLKMNKKAFELAFRERSLVLPPPYGAKTELRETFKTEAKRYNMWGKVKKALKEADIDGAGRRWFR